MNNTSNILTNKRIATLMFISALLMVFAMLHHPQETQQGISQNSAMKWVHGSLIFLLVFNAFGLGRLVELLRAKGRDTSLGMLFYYVGLGSVIGAALVSGFVQTSLPHLFSADTETFSNFIKFSSILNQSLAKLGIISFGAAGFFLSPALIADRGISLIVGGVGCVVGITLIGSILAGFYLSVLTMTILTILIVIWHIAIAVWLAKH